MTRRLLSLVALLLAPALAAQTGGEVRRVVLTNGTVLVGTVADETADPVVVLTRGGVEQRVARAQIAEITAAPAGRFRRADPTRTRLAFSPTGRTLGRGRTRVGTLLYVFPNAAVGLSDRVDVGGAFFSTFGFGGGGEDIYAAAPGVKVGLVDAGRVAVAVGANAFGVLDEDGGDTTYGLAPYGAVTLGDEATSFSASATTLIGGTVGDGGVEVAPVVLIAAGGEIQVNNGLKLLADLSLPVGGGSTDSLDFADLVAVFAGVRLFGDRYALDVLGVAFDVLVLPAVSFSYTF